MAINIHNLTTNYIINRLFRERAYYFDIEFFSHLFRIKSTESSQWFKRLEKKGFIIEIEKGKYLVLGFQKEKVLSESFFIGTKILTPSYVSFWNALNYYGFTEQVPKTIFIASTKRKGDIVFENIHYKYIKISSRKFFGYCVEKSGDLSYLIAEPEKALIDSLDEPRYAGGMEEVIKCLYNSRTEIQIDKLIEYAIILGSKSLISRLGYILDKFGINMGKLKPYVPRFYVRLNPQKKMANIWDKDWRVNVNVPLEKLSQYEGVY